MSIKLEGGKYEFYFDALRSCLMCMRHGRPWRDFVGDKAVLTLYQYAQAQRDVVVKEALAVLEQMKPVRDSVAEHRYPELVRQRETLENAIVLIRQLTTRRASS